MSAGRFSPRVAEVIWTRDEGRCFRCGKPLRKDARGLDWSMHHRRPRGVGGSTLAWVGMPSNGLCLCGSGTTGCHGWVESHRDEARDEGFLVHLNGVAKPKDVPAWRWGHTEYVWLTDDGYALPVGKTAAREVVAS